jgi:hypothetical protein
MNDTSKLEARNKLNDIYFNQIKNFYVQKYVFYFDVVVVGSIDLDGSQSLDVEIAQGSSRIIITINQPIVF